MTHHLFGGDGVAEIVDFATPSKRIKELFQENFGDFGALATDVDAGLGIVDTDSLEVIVLDGGVAFGNGGIDILNATGGAELSDAGMLVGEAVFIVLLGAGGVVAVIRSCRIVEAGGIVGGRARGTLAVGINYHDADTCVLDVILGDSELRERELPLIEGMLVGGNLADEVNEIVVGLEVHAELNTKTKIYCGCKNLSLIHISEPTRPY